MSSSIPCPYCEKVLTLKTIKAGKFKPTCTQCQQPFQLVITADDPPHLRAAKLPTPQSGTAPLAPTKPVQADATQTLPAPLTSQPTTHRPNRPEDIPQGRPDSRGFSVAADATLPAPNLPETSATLAPASSTATPTVKNSRAGEFATQDFTAPSPSAARAPASSRPSSSAHSSSNAKLERPLPERLGGYRILKELGRGGMGSVYLARQLSLDRQVAVKTIQSDWASNPRAIARFIREAYAAAQLTHHNVVQIYDLGQDRDINFFSMELVEGGSLDDLLKQKGKLPPKEATIYILHAARGLKFAHDHGMIHRDIKPANLMLTRDALVKVADLGLVKTPALNEDEQSLSGEDNNLLLASARSQVTGAGSAMGTPAYMSPEQAEDATAVDLRADIYSLGCTFYALLVGQPPFVSKNALEVLSKLKTEPIVRPDRIAAGIPAELGAIVEKMTAKLPSDRYDSLAQVIEELEAFLQAQSPRDTSLAEQRADQLLACATDFNRVPAARLRTALPPAFVGVAALLSIAMGLYSLRLAIAGILVIIAVPLITLGVAVVTRSTNPIPVRLRAAIFGSSLSDWITWAVAGLISILLLWAFGLIGYLFTALVIATIAAAVYYFAVARTLGKQRRQSLQDATAMLQRMRIEGTDEAAIRRFVGEFSGNDWEEFFECLFGYDALRQTRASLESEQKLRGKRRFQIWRDAIVDRLDARLANAREVRERRVLARVETASLKAAGMNDQEAQQRAAEMANSLVSVAMETRGLSLKPGAQEISPAEKRARIKQMLEAARSGKPKTLGAVAVRNSNAVLGSVLGGKFRFALGALMVLGCALWANENKLLDREKLSQVTSTVSQASTLDSLTNTSEGIEAGKRASESVAKIIGDTRPLSTPLVGQYFSSFVPGLIGLLILASALISGWRYSLFAIPAAALTLLLPAFGVPSFGLSQGAAWLSGGIGLILLTLGAVFGRSMYEPNWEKRTH